MHALAIETSGRIGSVAAVGAGQILGSAEFPTGLRHASEMLPTIDALLKTRKWSPQDVQELYVSIGPGSFTGLRIGVTWAKTLTMVTGCRLVAVNTSRVLAENVPLEARNLAVIFDARRGKVYAELYLRSGGDEPWQLSQPGRLQQVDDLLAAPRPLHILGPGVELHRVPATADIYCLPPEYGKPRIEAVAGIGYAMARAGEFTEPDQLSPIYVRKPEAQEKREGIA